MSIDTCKECGDLVDTDFDEDAYLIGDKCICERCRKFWPEMGEWMVGEGSPLDESSEEAKS